MKTLLLLLLLTFAAAAREYPATVLEVHDGDTVRVRLDLGFELTLTENVRLAGIDAPELNTDAGRQARAALKDLLPDGCRVLVVTGTRERDKFGRVLGTLQRDGKSVATAMLEAGHARPYDGGAR